MPEQQLPVKVILNLSKETKRTVRYDAAEADYVAPIDSIYVKKFALNGARPKQIAVTLEFDQ